MVVSLAKRACVLATLGLAASTACGGISTRHVGDNESGSGGDGQTGGNESGGRGSGGRGSGGSTTGVGGVGAFTAGGVGGVGGSVGGGFTGGVGGTVSAGGVGASGGVGAAGGVFMTGGVGGSTGGAPQDPSLLPWTADGYISPKDNLLNVEGNFYFSTDCASALPFMLPCTVADPNLLGPDGQLGWAMSSEVACAKGTAMQVVTNPTTGNPAYAEQWGALLGIAIRDYYGSVFNAWGREARGFSFDLIGVAPGDLRVNIVTPSTIGSSHFATVPVARLQHVVRFDQALQGSWVLNPSPLDTTAIMGLEFHVYTSASAPTPFDFCVRNLRVLFD